MSSDPALVAQRHVSGIAGLTVMAGARDDYMLHLILVSVRQREVQLQNPIDSTTIGGGAGTGHGGP